MLSKLKSGLVVSALFLNFAAAPVLARTEVEAMEDFMEMLVAPMLGEPALIDAIKAQNEKHAALSDADIKTMDDAWRAEADAGTGATIDPVLKSAVSELLRKQVAGSDGVVTEIFVTDNKGMNVAASSATSDYWQGDEDKFTMTYPVGATAIFVGEIEQDQSTGKFQGQVSMTIADPATGKAIGMVTAGFVADALM